MMADTIDKIKLAAKTHPVGTASLGLLVLLMLLRVWWVWAGPLRPQIGPVNCDELLETAERKALTEQAQKPEQLPTAIAALYHIPESQVTVSHDSGVRGPPSNTYLNWTANNRDHGMALTTSALANEHDVQIHQWLSYRSSAPSVSDLITCLGAPESYAAWYGFGGAGDFGLGLFMRLFYPERGVNVRADTSITLPQPLYFGGPFPFPVPLKRIKVWDVGFAPAATRDGLIRDILSGYQIDVLTEPGASILRWNENLALPWPGDQSKLQYWTTRYPRINLLPAQPLDK